MICYWQHHKTSKSLLCPPAQEAAGHSLLPMLVDCMEEAAEIHRHFLLVMEGVDGSLRLLLLREEDEPAALADASLPIHEHSHLRDLRTMRFYCQLILAIERSLKKQ